MPEDLAARPNNREPPAKTKPGHNNWPQQNLAHAAANPWPERPGAAERGGPGMMAPRDPAPVTPLPIESRARLRLRSLGWALLAAALLGEPGEAGELELGSAADASGAAEVRRCAARCASQL